MANTAGGFYPLRLNFNRIVGFIIQIIFVHVIFLVDMKTISFLVPKLHQYLLQDQKTKHETSFLSTKRYINTEF